MTSELRVARSLFRHRFVLAIGSLAVVTSLALLGGRRVADFSTRMAGLGDTSNGAGGVTPLVFDPRMDLWFGADDEVVQAFHQIEERFVAEDYVMVTFEVPTDASDEETRRFGVFAREHLATIARLTDELLTIPGVRHVRSLTRSPWIRYGTIGDGATQERGLLISDLVEGDPGQLSERDLVERMIAVLGAQRAAARVGEESVRRVLGPGAVLADHIGEPLLLGTIINDSGTTTALQVQVLRPRVDADVLAAAFEPGSGEHDVAPALYAVQAQRAALRGIEHVLRVESGLAPRAPGYAQLEAWIDTLPQGTERDAAAVELRNPNKNFMAGAEGRVLRKYFEYEPDGKGGKGGKGGYVDLSDPSQPLEAPASFRPEPRSPHVFHVGGTPLFERNFETVGMSDSKYMGLMMLAIAVLLALVFRSIAGTLVPLTIVLCAVAGMLGAAFLKGDLINNLTMVSPNMLTAVSIADAIHLLASWQKLRGRYAERSELIIEVLRRNALPVFLTSVTTAVGFYSLTISEMIPVRMLGYTAGFGALLAWALSMSVVPAALSLVPHRGRTAPELEEGALERGWEARLSRFVLRSRRGILIGSGLALVVSIWGLVHLRIDSDFRAMFPDDNPVMSDFNWIEARMGGVGDFEIVFDGVRVERPAWSEDDAARLARLRLRRAGAAAGEAEFEPLDAAAQAELTTLSQEEAAFQGARIAVSADFLREVDAFEARLRQEMAEPGSALAVLTDLTSPLDILRRMHQVQNDNSGRFYRVPAEEDVPAAQRQESLEYDEWTEEWLLVPAQDASTLAAQYYLQYENGAKPGENLSTQVSMDRTRFRMQGRLEQSPSEVTLDAVRRVAEIGRDEFPGLSMRVVHAADLRGTREAQGAVLADVDLSGKMMLFARTNRIFTVGFVQSMAIALTLITLLIGTIFRSLRLALVSIIPNVLPIMMPLSVFGLLGRPLDAPAIFVASVALGVCVDDTLHFFTKFVRARRQGLGLEHSFRYVFETTGTAITFTSVILVLGFGTLVLSDFSPNYMMGTLAAAMVALAWVADIVVTPAVLSLVFHDSPETDTPDASAPTASASLEPALQ